MDCSPLGSSVHEISQERILEWVAISFSKGSSQLRGQTHISCIGRWILYHSAAREAHSSCSLSPNSASTENDFYVPKGRFKANLQGATGWIPGWVKGGVGAGFGVLGISENQTHSHSIYPLLLEETTRNKDFLQLRPFGGEVIEKYRKENENRSTENTFS